METLEQYHVKSLSCYESVSREGKPFKLISSSEEPIFCYAHNDFVKIYRPNSKLRFLYGGEKSEEYVFGLEQLPNKGDILFILREEKKMSSPFLHTISMLFASIARLHKYQEVLSKVFHFASYTSSSYTTLMKQGSERHRNRWKRFLNLECLDYNYL